MSTTVDYKSRSRPARDAESPAPLPRRRGRVAITVVLLCALALSAVLQQTAFSYRYAAVNRNRPAGAPMPSRVANLDSFSLALLLGGLRGPLVMFLWINSESQKSEKDLDSFDTQVELIRLLQPEFDTVHLFQIWNKAYNVSVQLASLANKYATILDAVEYARRTDQANPNDLNILSAIGGLFTDKLGNSTEKEYYRRRVRSETLPLYRVTFPAARTDAFKKAVADAGLDQSRLRVTTDAGGSATAIVDKLGGDRVLATFNGPGVKVEAVPRQSLRPVNRSGRRTEMDTLVDARGDLLPEFIRPTHAVPAGAEDNDGSELQYLKQFQPYPYGVSPLALGYDYAKRAQVLSRVTHQKHLQLSDQVIDNQPGLALKQWADEEWDRGRRLEQRGLAKQPAGDTGPRELRTAAAAPDTPVVDRAAIAEAIFSYQKAAQVAAGSLAEVTSHIERFPSKLQNYYSQSDNLKAIISLNNADALYLQAVTKSDRERGALLAQAKTNYQEALRWFEILILKYYSDDTDAAALKYSTATVADKSSAELQELTRQMMVHLAKTYKSVEASPHGSDVLEYDENIRRITQRLSLIK